MFRVLHGLHGCSIRRIVTYGWVESLAYVDLKLAYHTKVTLAQMHYVGRGDNKVKGVTVAKNQQYCHGHRTRRDAARKSCSSFPAQTGAAKTIRMKD